MNNKVNTNEQLSRMKALMGYGLKTESKDTPYSSIENQKLAADGKVYAIIREGAKYYIKSAPNKQNLVKEDFNYIGGFRNRKDNEYTSFANAQKQFDLKMMSLKEAANKTDFNINSWDLDKKENVVIEATDKMKKEILRERQIMKNAMMIAEQGKGKKECKNGVCDSSDMKGIKDFEKSNIEKVQTECGNLSVGDAPEVKTEGVVKETSEKVLAWNRKDKDYMDKSHGTEIGDSAPFDDAEARNIDDGDKIVTRTGEMKNGVVENHGISMHDTDNQNSPEVGVGEGPSDDNNKPFDDKKGKQIDEAIDDFGAEEDPMGDDLDGEDPMGDEEPMDDDFGAEEGEPIGDEMGPEELDDNEFDGDEDFEDEDDDIYEDDLESRVEAMEDLLSRIAAKLGVEEGPVDDEVYDDDDLFDDEENTEYALETNDDELGDDEFGDEEFGDEEPMDDDLEDEDEMPMESRRRNGVQIFETRAFRNAMHRQRMNEDDERQSKISKEIGRMMRTKGGFKKSRALRGNRSLDNLSDEELDKLLNTKYESTNRYGNLVNEEGMTPFKDAGRVPQGNMNKLDDFGKHPAYQKVVMSLPPKDLQEFPDYYDMNDDSVKNDMPYGERIGDGAPFDIDPDSIDNAIAEAFDRLKKKRHN